MKKVLLPILFLISNLAIAGEITCGSFVESKTDRSNLTYQIDLKSPVTAELNNERVTFEKKEETEFSKMYQFDSLENYAFAVLPNEGMIKVVKRIYLETFICTVSDSNKVGVGSSLEDAVQDLQKQLK